MRIKAIAEFERPRTKKHLRFFLGSISYYQQFIDGFARLSSMLTPAVSLKVPLWVVWIKEMTAAFSKFETFFVHSCFVVHSQRFRRVPAVHRREWKWRWWMSSHFP